MKARRLELVAALLFAGWVVAWFAFSSAGIKDTTASIVDHRAPFLLADFGVAYAPPPATETSNASIANAENAPISNADVAVAAELVTRTDTTAASDEPESFVKVASADPSQTLPPETPPVQAAASTSDLVPKDLEAMSSLEILDGCQVTDICIDRYLWALYQQTPKEDTIKVQEQRQVTVKKKKKTVTVTRSFTRLVDENFSWKDPKAAEKAGMSMMDYVIGGMDRGFKRKLFQGLRAAEQAGLSPGITSAFRDDYRQSIASGLKAATDRSWHGGSFRGGYGNGLAADVVSVAGGTRAQRWISTENLWKWIDAHGNEFGIGRPYLDRDPPHVGPIDGKEYVARRGTKTVQAESDVKKRNRQADDSKEDAARRETKAVQAESDLKKRDRQADDGKEDAARREAKAVQSEPDVKKRNRQADDDKESAARRETKAVQADSDVKKRNRQADDGKESAARRETKAAQAEPDVKKRNRQADDDKKYAARREAKAVQAEPDVKKRNRQADDDKKYAARREAKAVQAEPDVKKRNRQADDGKEHAARRGTKAIQAEPEVKKRNRQADDSTTKRPRT
jgi:hypothetical protein